MNKFVAMTRRLELISTAGAFVGHGKPAKNGRFVHCRKHLLLARKRGGILTDRSAHGKLSSTKVVEVGFEQGTYCYQRRTQYDSRRSRVVRFDEMVGFAEERCRIEVLIGKLTAARWVGSLHKLEH